MGKCIHCGTRTGLMMELCDSCIKKESVRAEERVVQERLQRAAEAASEAVKDQRRHQLVEESKNVVVTTTPSLEGYRVVRTIDVVTAECVLGIDAIADLYAKMRDIFGGRSGTVQDALREARTTCLRELRLEACVLGGNAVVGVDLDYSEISGQGKSMLFLVASGTAVIVEPLT